MEGREWLRKIAAEHLTTSLPRLSPSEWAEQRRYLPPSVTPTPGYYSFDVAPYLREVVDCMDPRSPVRRVAYMKGVQLGITVGVLENAVGFAIDHERVRPMMMVTATEKLAKKRLEKYILPMLQSCGLKHLIQSSDTDNKRKSGQRGLDLEFAGGGFLTLAGANSKADFSSLSIARMLLDEVDRFPQDVSGDGDPIELAHGRTKAFSQTRKVLYVSSPSEEETSLIAPLFKSGDQRYFHVPCQTCGEYQVLRFSDVNEHGDKYGLTWETTDEGHLVPGSTRYICRHCGAPHANRQKLQMLPQGEWQPSATSSDPELRSYHTSALYSPVTMATWDDCAKSWLAGWDPAMNEGKGGVKDHRKLQVFNNNTLGVPHRVTGQKLTTQMVSAHRRSYAMGVVPNKFAAKYSAGQLLCLTGFVDVHGSSLFFAVFGWAPGRACYLVSYECWDGDTSNLQDPETWGKLRHAVRDRTWKSDDGWVYGLGFCLVDAGAFTDTVYDFCAEFSGIVFPARGRQQALQNSQFKQFHQYQTSAGRIAFSTWVDFYKDRWGLSMRREWNGVEQQREWTLNVPTDTPNKALKELACEYKRKHKGRWEWYRPHHAPNELFDCLVGSTVGFEILALDRFRNACGDPKAGLSWEGFVNVVQANPGLVRVTRAG